MYVRMYVPISYTCVCVYVRMYVLISYACVCMYVPISYSVIKAPVDVVLGARRLQTGLVRVAVRTGVTKRRRPDARILAVLPSHYGTNETRL